MTDVTHAMTERKLDGFAPDELFGRWRSDWRSWPICTIVVLSITATLSILQFPFPGIRENLWRDPEEIKAGQWWRLFTALFVQDDLVWQIVVVLTLVGVVGVLAETIFGHKRWILLYFGCGMVGQVFGVLWLPNVNDAGASVAGAGLVGGVCAWLLFSMNPLPWRFRIWGIVWLLIGIGLIVSRDMHGPPLLLGFVMAELMFWRDRRER